MSDKPFLATFLAAAHGVHISGAGTKETSYYTALDNLLDSIGETLKPKVRCVMQLKSLGAGNPDGGPFTADQFDRKTPVRRRTSPLPRAACSKSRRQASRSISLRPVCRLPSVAFS